MAKWSELVDMVSSVVDEKGFLRRLSDANKERQKNWPGVEKADLMFRGVELAGEVGELLNAVKKLYRNMNGIKGNVGVDIEALKANIKEEVGDVLICLSLLADDLDIDVEAVTIDKFNKTSKKHGMEVFLK